MKKILMTVTFMVMTGGAYAANFANLAVNAAAAEYVIAPTDQKIEVLPTIRNEKIEKVTGKVAAKGAAYSSSCRVHNGTAVGTIYNHSTDMLSFSGDMMLYYYDKYGNEITKDRSHEYVAVWPTSSEEITRNGAPGNAVSCSVEGIDDNQNPSPLPNSNGMGSGFTINTLPIGFACRVDNGAVTVVVNNSSPNLTLSYNGEIYIYYYADKYGTALSYMADPIETHIKVAPLGSEDIVKKTGPVNLVHPERAVFCSAGIDKVTSIEWQSLTSGDNPK